MEFGLMDFYLKCGTRLTPKKVKPQNQAIIVLACNKCGQKIKKQKNLKINGKAITHSPKQLVSVIDKEKPMRKHINRIY